METQCTCQTIRIVPHSLSLSLGRDNLSPACCCLTRPIHRYSSDLSYYYYYNYYVEMWRTCNTQTQQHDPFNSFSPLSPRCSVVVVLRPNCLSANASYSPRLEAVIGPRHVNSPTELVPLRLVEDLLDRNLELLAPANESVSCQLQRPLYYRIPLSLPPVPLTMPPKCADPGS